MQPARYGGFVRNYGSPPVLAPHLRALSGYVKLIVCCFLFRYFHLFIVLYNADIGVTCNGILNPNK